MSKVLSYGAFKALCEKLQHQVYSLNKYISFLKQECQIQGKIIEQLKTLHSSTLQLKTNGLCQAGHRYCKIQHDRFNFVSCRVRNQLYVPKKMSYSHSLTSAKSNDDKFFKKLSKTSQGSSRPHSCFPSLSLVRYHPQLSFNFIILARLGCFYVTAILS